MFPGGNPKQFQNMQKQLQKMQADLVKQQEELEKKIWTVSSGGGMVTIEMNGKYETKSIKLNKDAVDPNDVEMLEDLILSALKEAFQKVNKDVEEGMSKLTGNMKIPGLF
jgi:DNA-binding YbaB/EbfC family protein